MEVYTSDSSVSDGDVPEQRILDYGHSNLTTDYVENDFFGYKTNSVTETILLNHNALISIPLSIVRFVNLKVLDLSSNNLMELPDVIGQLPLKTLIVKNNRLTNDALPKSLKSKRGSLRELNMSGNLFTQFPEQVLELTTLKYLYLGGNKITSVSKDIWKMQSLQLLSIGGNRIQEIPDSVGNLEHLQALVLCDNLIEKLPDSIARLTNLKTLLLHKNQLRTLPKDIIALKNLNELSLRDNPLVVRFVQDMTLHPPTLLELAGRTVKTAGIQLEMGDLPKTLMDYLSCANCCVNPSCKGVYFDNRVEHIKFVDFCGKYRVPLLQYLCSSKCIEDASNSGQVASASGYMMKKVLLG